MDNQLFNGQGPNYQPPYVLPIHNSGSQNIPEPKEPFYKSNLWGTIGFLLSLLVIVSFIIGITVPDLYFLIFFAVFLGFIALAFSVAGFFFKPRWLGCLGTLIGSVSVMLPIILIAGILIGVGQWKPPVHAEDTTEIVLDEEAIVYDNDSSAVNDVDSIPVITDSIPQ